MRKDRKQRSERWSLTLAYTGIILAILAVTSVIVTLVVTYLVYQGTLQYGDVKLNTGHLILNMLLWGFVVGAAAAFISSRFSLKPFNKILNMVNRLAAGDYSARLESKGMFGHAPWMKELAASFNKLAEELEKTEMLRSDFVNNFSHEFKTPIVSIAGFAKIIRRGNLSQEQIDEYLAAIEEESLRLSHMASSVLSLTTVENQAILTDVKQLNLSEQLRTAMLLLEQKWEKKHIEPVLPTEEYTIEASEKLTEQIWINLFDNAIKFAPEYSSVEASVTQSEHETTVTISNIGEPIPDEKQEKLFRKFYQGDESHSDSGNGIGLAVVKKIVDLHKGTVEVSCHDDKVFFIVRLPR